MKERFRSANPSRSWKQPVGETREKWSMVERAAAAAARKCKEPKTLIFREIEGGGDRRGRGRRER